MAVVRDRTAAEAAIAAFMADVGLIVPPPTNTAAAAAAAGSGEGAAAAQGCAPPPPPGKIELFLLRHRPTVHTMLAERGVLQPRPRPRQTVRMTAEQ